MTAETIRYIARAGMSAGIRTLSELHVAADVAAREEITLSSIAISTGLPMESVAHSAALLQTSGLVSVRNIKGRPEDILISKTPAMVTLFAQMRISSVAGCFRAKDHKTKIKTKAKAHA